MVLIGIKKEPSQLIRHRWSWAWNPSFGQWFLPVSRSSSSRMNPKIDWTLNSAKESENCNSSEPKTHYSFWWGDVVLELCRPEVVRGVPLSGDTREETEKYFFEKKLFEGPLEIQKKKQIYHYSHDPWCFSVQFSTSPLLHVWAMVGTVWEIELRKNTSTDSRPLRRAGAEKCSCVLSFEHYRFLLSETLSSSKTGSNVSEVFFTHVWNDLSVFESSLWNSIVDFG